MHVRRERVGICHRSRAIVDHEKRALRTVAANDECVVITGTSVAQ
jgi:hypothetical protein